MIIVLILGYDSAMARRSILLGHLLVLGVFAVSAAAGLAISQIHGGKRLLELLETSSAPAP